MQKVIDRVTKTFGMTRPISEKETEQTREVLLYFRSGLARTTTWQPWKD
jgi:hypothetical protein